MNCQYHYLHANDKLQQKYILSVKKETINVLSLSLKDGVICESSNSCLRLN